MAATLELVVTAKDLASGTLGRVDKSAGGLAKTLGGPLKIGALAGVAALGSVVALGVSFVKAAAEEEASIKRLAAAVDASGGSWAKNGKQIESVIQQRQKLAFSDDELRSSLALLTAITGDSGEALERQTIAMDFARGANISLETASKLLGKVTDENVNVLGRYGIRVKAGADATELLGLVQKKFAGQSAAFADSTAGRWARVNIQFDNIKETIGMALLPTVSRLADKFATFLEAHEDDITKMSQDFAIFAERTMPKVEEAAADVADALEELADVIVPTVRALNELDQMLDGELSKAFLNSLPIIREFKQMMDLKQTIEEAKSDLKGFAVDVALQASGISTLTSTYGDAKKALDLFGVTTEDAKTDLTDYTLSVSEADRLQADLIASGEDVAGVVGDIGGAMGETKRDIDSEFLPGLKDSIGTLQDLQTEADETRKRLFSMFKEPTQEEQIAESNLANYRLELQRIEQGLSPLTDAQRTYLDSLGLTGDEAKITELMIGGLARADAERALHLETKAIPKTQEELDLLRLTRDAAKESADVKYAQAPKLDAVIAKTEEESRVLDILRLRMNDAATSAVPGLYGSIDGVRVVLENANLAATGFKDALYNIPTHIKTQLDLDILRSFINADPAGVAPIPHAEGGVFNRAHLGIVAEAGPEAIIPLNNPSRAAAVMAEAGLKGGGGTIINVNSPLVQVNGEWSPATQRRSEAGVLAQLHRAARRTA